MLVRPANLDDAEAIRAIYNVEVVESTVTFDLVPRTLAQQRSWQLARSGALTVVVAERDGDIVGFGALSAYRDRPGYRTSVEDSVYVDRGTRGLGVGDALLTRLVDDARAHGFHAVFARIVGGHHASIALHRKHGFRVVGTEREVGRKFGQWLDVVLMEHLVVTRPRPAPDGGPHPVLRLVDAFGDHDPAERLDLLESAVAPEFRFCHPTEADPVRGLGEMGQYIEARRQADPASTLDALGAPTVHHDVFQLRWRADGGGGSATGTFTGEVDHTGRIVRVDVFVDPAGT
jgi:L-amino acid N-acyltransferase